MTHDPAKARLARTTLASIAAILFASLAPPAHAAPASDRTAAGSATSSHPRQTEQKYCIVQQFTGSLVPRKVCKTRRDWAAQGITLDEDLAGPR